MSSLKRYTGFTGVMSILALFAVLAVTFSTSTVLADHVRITNGEGDLTFIERISNSGAIRLDGARQVTTSPDGKHVYVVSLDPFSRGAVTAFSRDASTGKLPFVEAHFNDHPGMRGVQDVVISPDGNFAYLVTLTDQSVLTFSRNTITGALTYQATVDINRNLTDLEITADGKHAYAASSSSI